MRETFNCAERQAWHALAERQVLLGFERSSFRTCPPWRQCTGEFQNQREPLINTGALARWTNAPWLVELFQQFVSIPGKPFKRLDPRTVILHRAKAAVLLRTDVSGREISHPKPVENRRSWATLAALVALFLVAGQCLADELSQKGREVFKKNCHSVVTVQVVVKSKFSMGGMGGQSNESKQDLTGTVIDSSGLTVLSLAATDPSQMMQNVMGGMDEDSKFKLETELSDVKILLEDGTEVPSEVVLRDRDLDLAFIRPRSKPQAELAPLDLSKSGKVEILDQVIALNRLGNAAGRAFAASVERIAAVVEKPRLFYVPEASFTMTALGAPAFTLDGKVVGIFVLRTSKGRSSGGNFALGPQSGNMAGIIVPAEDIQKAARQVPPETKSKEQQ